MKYACTIWLIIAAFIMSPHNSSAQASLGLFTSSVSNSSPTLNTQISIFTELLNLSATDTFRGVVNFKLANKDSIITNVNVVGMPNFAGTSITLAPQEQKAALFTVQLLPSYFSIGNDIIIVWPVAAVATPDSAKAPIVISAETGISDIASQSVKAYVADERLMIISDDKTGLQQVQIFDIAGRKVGEYTIDATAITISLHDLPKGIYIADILTTTGESRKIKFVR
jgi:hypothetical protein